MTINLDVLAGKKTYLAAFGLLGHAAYLAFVAKDYAGAVQSLFAGLGAFGLRSAIDRAATPVEPEAPAKAK